MLELLKTSWLALYGEQDAEKLNAFVNELVRYKADLDLPPQTEEWYKDAVVYSLYVDLFNKDFRGLEEKLEYLSDLGVNCLWLLPILESPLKDGGFDISDYRKIRADLLGLNDNAGEDERNEVFQAFLDKAHRLGIRVIFDIALNHASDQHPWFQEAIQSKDNPYRDYFIWSKDTDKYKEARIIFEGLEESNWKKQGDEYYFHRFFEFQPDLNFRNPDVLIEMSRNLLYWLKMGVDGFRADAIPYIWKDEGTACENEPHAHTILKFFRSVIDYVRPNTLLLAEACQKPHKVVKYFGDGDECNAAYHFPLMPMMFKALAVQSSEPIKHTLSLDVTPAIPDNAQWLTFLRCHDELSLELVYVTEEDRKLIHDHYCRKPQWDFRLGQGVASRLSELLERNPDKIALAYSMMLTLPGTPVIYYGDEFAKLNDNEYYKKMIKVSGKDDTRFLVRGTIDWKQLSKDLKDEDSLSHEVFKSIKKQIAVRKQYKVFSRGDIQWLDLGHESLLAYIREDENDRILVIQNLGYDSITISHEVISHFSLKGTKGEMKNEKGEMKNEKGEMKNVRRDLFGKKLKIKEDGLQIKGLRYYWLPL